MAFILQPGLGYRPAPGVNASTHLRNLREYLWNKAGGRCALCGEPVDVEEVHADHIVPSSKGGSDAVHNLQATHAVCNSRKGDRAPGKARSNSSPSTPNPQEVDRYVDLLAISRYMSVPIGTVKKWLRSGQMTGTYLGNTLGWRVQESEVLRFIDSRRTTQPDQD